MARERRGFDKPSCLKYQLKPYPPAAGRPAGLRQSPTRAHGGGEGGPPRPGSAPFRSPNVATPVGMRPTDSALVEAAQRGGLGCPTWRSRSTVYPRGTLTRRSDPSVRSLTPDQPGSTGPETPTGGLAVMALRSKGWLAAIALALATLPACGAPAAPSAPPTATEAVAAPTAPAPATALTAPTVPVAHRARGHGATRRCHSRCHPRHPHGRARVPASAPSAPSTTGSILLDNRPARRTCPPSPRI